MNRVETRDGELMIPTIFEKKDYDKLQRGQPIYEYYVGRRAESDLEYLSRIEGDNFIESLKSMAIEYVMLEKEGNTDDQMKMDELSIVIGALGFWELVDAARTELAEEEKISEIPLENQPSSA
jgi:hypothetical protein